MKKIKPRIAKKHAKRECQIALTSKLMPLEPNNLDNELQKELTELKNQLNEARLKYRHVTQSHAVLKQELTEKQVLFLEAEAVKQQAEAMAIENKQIREQLSIISTRAKADAIGITDLKRSNLKSRIALGEKQLVICSLDQELLVQKQQVLKVRNHLSYKLGFSLIKSTKSWRNLLALPGKLLQIRGEARLRRDSLKQKALRNQILLLPASSQEAELVTLKRELQFLPALNLASKLKGLKIACVMDTFTYESYAPEASLLQLSPNNWQAELETFAPDMLFIESAWRGKDDLWGNKVGHTSQELVGIVNLCKRQQITTLFWNKEDPIHFETFLNTAKLFDHIFTTDIDCISRYKKALGHNQVYFLPFAAQPKVNNPIEKYHRQDKFCFAGAYYVKYPERTKDLNNFVLSLPEYKDIDIYDRNFGKDDANYMFPEEYQPYIIGTLPYEQIDKAYKGYNYAINLNSIKQSQSMFARRAFELLASNTVTVSNFSHGLRLMFGDLVFTSDSGEEIVRRLEKLTGDNIKLRQFRLLALRKVLSEHTYLDRLNYIHSKLANTELLDVMPKVRVLAYVKTPEALEYIVNSFERQSYTRKWLTVVISGFTPALEWSEQHNHIEQLTPIESESIELDKWACDGWVSVMVPEDYYGEEYLTDLALATRYVDHKVIGKKACFRWQNDLVQSFPQVEYCEVGGLTLRQSLIATSLLPAINIRQWLSTLYTWQADVLQFSIDSFNYCMNGAYHCETLPEFVQPQGINTGISLTELQVKAESMAPAALDISKLLAIRPAELVARFKPARDSHCVAALAHDKLAIASQLPDGKHEYWYANKDYTPSELNAVGGKLTLHLETTPGLNLQVVMLFLDANKQRLGHTIFTANKNADIVLPEDVEFLRPGLRIYAAGAAEVSNFYLEAKPSNIPKILTSSKYLVVTNNYPSYKDLYKNGFVHSRVSAYKKRGIMCDIFKFNKNDSLCFDEYQNINKMAGGKDELSALLESNKYRTILVHFLDENMWEILKEFVATTKIVVWVHGAEIHPWYRRQYNYTNNEEVEKAKVLSEAKMAFWRSILKTPVNNLKLVFVSHTFKREVFEDLGFELNNIQYEVIHNPIDTDKFDYIEKPISHRKKILSIRPFASRQYANDLSVKAIVELSKHKIFDDLEFTIIGDGPLFDSTIEPILNFENVTIKRTFVNHDEISELHKCHGLFLCPTRWDSQGVSRDEAMSSGLVPLTTNIAAIPEFVNNTCAILSNPEDISGLVDGVVELYHNPEKFREMSRNARLRTNENLRTELIIEREISEIINNAV